MASTYAYTWTGTSFFTTTVNTGPVTSLSGTNLLAGTATSTTVNTGGQVVAYQVSDIQSGSILESASASTFLTTGTGSTITPFPTKYNFTPLGTSESLGYDSNGEGILMSATDQLGVASSYDYDGQHRLTSMTRGAVTWNIAYNTESGLFGRYITITAPGETTETRDEESSPFGITQTLNITGAQNISTTRTDSGGTLTITSTNSTTYDWSTDTTTESSLAESVRGNTTEPWDITYSFPGNGWARTVTDQNGTALSGSTVYDAIGRSKTVYSPSPSGSGAMVPTTLSYTNGVLISVSTPSTTINYSYQPDGSTKTIQQGVQSITVSRDSGGLAWTCTNSMGEVLWKQSYTASTGATTFLPHGLSAQAVTTTPGVSSNIFSLASIGPSSSSTSSWQDETPYQTFFKGGGTILNTTNTIGGFGEINQIAAYPGGGTANATIVNLSPLGLPTTGTDVDGPFSITNSFDGSTGLTQTFTRGSHSKSDIVSPKGDLMGRTGYGQPDVSLSAFTISGNNILRTMTTDAGAVDISTNLDGQVNLRNFIDTSHEGFSINDNGGQTSWTTPGGTSLSLSPNEYNDPTGLSGYWNIGYDSAERVSGVSDASGSCSISHTNGQIFVESHTNGILNGLSVEHDYDDLGNFHILKLPNSVTVTYNYNSDGTLNTITTAAGVTGTYSNYDPVTGRAKNFSIGPLGVSSTFDGKGRNTGQSSTSNGNTLAYTGTYDADGHCSGMIAPEGAWSYGYNGSDGHGYLSSATGPQTLSYSFDAAGRKNGVSTDFRPNQQSNSDTVTVLGSVTPGAGVKINGTSVSVNGTTGLFSQSYNPSPGAWYTYKVTGTMVSSGTNYSAQQIRTAYLPPTTESLGYNTAGALNTDARFNYSWNDLDQMVTITETNAYTASTATQISCVYDLQGRRVQKTVNVGGKVTTRTTTLWDDWRPVYEVDYSGTTNTVAQKRYYTWGPDVSGDIDGAAGIGGLVEIMAVTGTAVTTSLPVYDGIGNIVAYVDGHTGTQVARYEYGPFGELLASYGPRANHCPFRFQTKMYDQETGYYYFGKRYYNSKTQTWISRDPLREDGGVNLYAYCNDDPVGNYDPIGLRDVKWYDYILDVFYKDHIKNVREQDSHEKIMRGLLGDKAYNQYQSEILTTSILGAPGYYQSKMVPVIDGLVPGSSQEIVNQTNENILTASAQQRLDFAINRWKLDAATLALSFGPGILEGVGPRLLLATVGRRTVASEAGAVVEETVFHTVRNARAGQGVLNGIDPAYLNPAARFGRAFYISNDADTTLAELAEHDASGTHAIRFNLNLGDARVLDLTDPATASEWGYSGGPITEATQAIGTDALKSGFNVIKFSSLRGPGINFAILDDFNTVLSPQMIVPTP